MKHIFIKLRNKITALCQPDPKSFPDPSVQEITWDRNLMNFYGVTLALMTFIISSLFLRLPFSISFLIFCSNIAGAIAFCLCCRTRPWVYHFVLSLSSFVAEYLAIEYIKETVYYHLGNLFITVTLVFVLTGNLWITLLSITLQIFMLVTQFKDKLADCIYEEEPKVFADKLVNHILLSTIILLAVNILLVKILEKRTIELSRAKIAIENTLEQQKTFIFSFSHELRNPINSLLGNLQLVLQEPLPSKTKEMLNTAKICGEILLHNINNVLDTGKNDIGKLEINPMPTQLNELFQKTWGIYSGLFRQKKLKSQLRIEKDLPPAVSIDSHKMNQILLNLIGNSIKFTEKGSVSVTVKWLQSEEVCNSCFEPVPYDEADEGLFEKEENISIVNRSSDSIPGFLGLNDSERMSNNITQNRLQQESKGMLKIIVKDTGPGMRPETLDKLFKKFSQVSESASQRQIGTGLGLFITKEICQAMNGEIRAYSKFNKGTTFVVCIPTTSVPMMNIQRADSESILQQLSLKHLKAIVADDSPFNINLICDYFAKFEASVLSVAYNGYDAFMKYKECKSNNLDVHIVTLDIDMPILDGKKACDGIRKYEKEHKLKPAFIILISGNYDKERIDEFINPANEHKADCFLRKPVSFSEFHRAVYSLVVNDS